MSSRRSQHSPAAYIFLTSIPGSLGLKIVPRRYIKHSVELIPQRVSQQSVHSSPSRVIKSQRSWVSTSRYQHSPAAIYIFLTSIPDSLGLEIVPRRYIKHSKESLPPHNKTSPGKSNLVPQENWNSSPQAASLSPVDSGSLSLTEHERVARLYSKS